MRQALAAQISLKATVYKLYIQVKETRQLLTSNMILLTNKPLERGAYFMHESYVLSVHK